MNASVCSSSCTTLAGICFATILQNTQSAITLLLGLDSLRHGT